MQNTEMQCGRNTEFLFVNSADT